MPKATPRKTFRHFVTQPAKLGPCGNCGRPILTGIDEGRPYRVEAWPANVKAELEARTNGRDSWSLAERDQVWYRDAPAIRYYGVTLPVVLDHACDVPMALDLIEPSQAGAVSVFVARAAPATDDDLAQALVTVSKHLGGEIITPPF